MDDKEFRKKLTAVAEWYTPTDADKPYAKLKKRKKQDEQLMELVGEDNEEDIEPIEHTGPNATLPPIVTRVRIQAVTCEDCGKFCENGRQKEKKIYTTGQRHWREKCVTCRKFRNPATGEYCISEQQSSTFFANLHRHTLGVNNTKFNEFRKKAGILIKE